MRLAFLAVLVSCVLYGRVQSVLAHEASDAAAAEGLEAPVEAAGSADLADPSVGSGANPAQNSEDALPGKRTEWSLIPAFGRNTDLGFLIGGVYVMADFDPAFFPYRWRTVNTAAFSVKETPGGATVPWSSVLSQWDVTGLASGKARIITEMAYSRTENEGYFGLGGNSDADAISPESTNDPNHRYQYLILEPRFRLNLRYKLTNAMDVWAGTYIRYIGPRAYKGSRLALDDEAGDAGLGDKVYGTSAHGLFQAAVGITWDTRDHETAPSKGFYGEFSTRGAFGAPFGQDIAYGGVTLNLRGYLSLVSDWLVLAGRVLTDDTFGNVPFYELARGGSFETLYLLGGATGIRGISTGRYAGKVRLLSSLELRLMYPRFRVGNHRFRLGNVAFADAGRMWAGWKTDDQLDGTGSGIKYGVGGGLRIQWGEAVMIRIDVAYSPEADAVYPHWPIITYVWYDHTF